MVDLELRDDRICEIICHNHEKLKHSEEHIEFISRLYDQKFAKEGEFLDLTDLEREDCYKSCKGWDGVSKWCLCGNREMKWFVKFDADDNPKEINYRAW